MVAVQRLLSHTNGEYAILLYLRSFCIPQYEVNLRHATVCNVEMSCTKPCLRLAMD